MKDPTFGNHPAVRRTWRERLTAVRYVWLTAGVVLTALVAIGAVTIWLGLIGWAVIAASALIGQGMIGPRVSAASQPDPTVFLDARTVGSLVRSMPDPVIVIDGQDRVIGFNRPALDIAPALRRGELVALAVRAPEIIEAVRQVRATGEPRRAQFVLRAPMDRWYETFAVPVSQDAPSSGREANSLMLAFHDLTPLRRIEEMRVDFVANASHELRTPLASLSGFIETLQGPARDDPAARARFLAIMKTQADRMARLIDDLLSLSRIELNEHLRPQTAIDLSSVVRQVIDALQPLAEERGVEILAEFPGVAAMVLGDRDELVRLFENLIENALKYAAIGKRVDVKIGCIGTEAWITVRDYGPGIAPEHLPRLTERFYRVDVKASRAEGGTGLGLALAKHTINRHRGRLQIESEPGKGASFTVRLPLAETGQDTKSERPPGHS